MRTPFKPTVDPAFDILHSELRPLSSLFAPRTVAVIGATDKPGSVGRTLLWNLISNPFGGTVFPVNPKRRSVLGIQAYPDLASVPDTVDLAVIATPAPTVPGIIRECVEAGVQGAIVISAGFKETGEAGARLEEEILTLAHHAKLRLIGPNCLGVMNPHGGLNATFANAIARPGRVGFVSQSGALCTAVLDWSLRENVGFSAFVSIGSMLDVGWGDLIYHLGDDPNTQSIVIYMETIGDARSFLSAAREVALTKPIIVIKAGRTEAAAKAAASHTGSLAGSDDVLDAAFRRCGVLRVNRISEMFNMAEVLAKQNRRPQGSRLTIITNAGGPGVLATDTLLGDGGELSSLSGETITALNQFLPSHWSHANPIDILGDADPERYARALEVAIQDQNSDGLLVVLTPQAMTNPTEIAAQLVPMVQKANKPVLASWMGGSSVIEGENVLNQASVPTYPFPDSAARVFNYMWRYSDNLRSIYETPVLPEDAEFGTPDRHKAQQIIELAQASDRTILTEGESKQILEAYGIPTVQVKVATDAEQAVLAANQLGYPVVLKLLSKTITHKTDVGGVQLNLTNETAVRWAYEAICTSVTEKVGAEHFQGVSVQPMIQRDGGYELIIGSSLDVQFGPVLLFGSGGQLVEVFRDRAVDLPPLNTTLARRLMERTQIYKALQGVRGRKAVDLAALEQLLVRFSQLVVEQPWIREIDINPLLARPLEPGDADQGDAPTPQIRPSLMALDARIVLHPATLPPDQLPRPAIRPYPRQYVAPWTLGDDTPVMIRPIRPEDEPLMAQFHKTLSEESVYFRYFHLVKLSHRIAHERLLRLCFMDYDREMALVAEHQNPETGDRQILAVGRLSKMHGLNEAEFAMLVSDQYQCKGLGTELVRRLIQVAKDERLEGIVAEVLPQNSAMQRVFEKVGFQLSRCSDVVKARLDLSAG
jgi:acetyltransferase